MAALNRADPATATPSLTARAAAPGVKLTPAVPTLTPAQLAALGVEIAPPASPTPAAQQITTPQIEPQSPAPAATDAPATATPEAPAQEFTAPTSLATATEGEAAAGGAVVGEAVVGEAVEAPVGPMPGAHLGKDGAWELPRQPDKDEREWLQGMNAKWRVVENPESVRLFLGADGKFGFDDFLDIINPLQHIPLVNIAYRSLTGDTIDGAAQLLGALPFGPLAMASTVTDLAFRSQTGAGMAENGLAMLFGDDEAPAEVAGIATAAGDAQLADAAASRRGSNR